ncbi:MAG: M48 family peptidase [Rhodocyclaceae bacterium]|nr:M48 family peptidase [Rhodocyclaceae bacterium]
MTHRILRLYILLLAAALGLAACRSVPITGRKQLQLISESQEMSLGFSSYQSVLKQEKLSRDPHLNQMVQRVGSRIAAATGRGDYKWEFKLIENDKMVNAFCLPGGKVAVYTGILPITRDETGLAAVIGHEVAHAIARHGGERLSLELLAEGVALATALSTKDEAKAQRNATLIGVGGAFGVLLPFSRKHESEADRMGLIFMAKAGYDPRAAADLWRRMEAASKGKAHLPEFFSTHPADATRIRQIEGWLPEAMGYYHPAR